MSIHKLSKLTSCVLCAGLLALTACSSDNDSPSEGSDTANTGSTDGGTTDSGSVDGGGTGGTDSGSTDAGSSDYLFVATQTPSFDAGQIERFTLGNTVTAASATPGTASDIRARTDGKSLYEIGRFNLDSLTKFAPDDPSTALYQYSVLNGASGSNNPYDVVFVNETKAYVILYGSNDVLIINPSATSQAEFITGTLDLSAYDSDSSPNANSGIIVDGRLFIAMERLDVFSPTRTGYIAVFDVVTDTEINTGQGTDGLFGVALETVQPSSMQYSPSTNEILVLSRGNIYQSPDAAGDFYSGGIETINLSDYSTELLLDDGTAASNDGFFFDMLYLSAEKVYMSTFDSFGVTSLRSFNPTTGVLNTDVIGELDGMDLSGMAIGPNGRLWVGIRGDAPGLRVIEPLNDSIVIENVPTALNPIDFVFIATTP